MVQDNKATLTYTQLLKEDLGIFRLVPEDGVIPDYKPGQFLTIGMPVPGEDNKIVRRAYSIASHPENKKFFEFVIRWVRKPFPGRLTTELFNAKVDITLRNVCTKSHSHISNKWATYFEICGTFIDHTFSRNMYERNASKNRVLITFWN